MPGASGAQILGEGWGRGPGEGRCFQETENGIEKGGSSLLGKRDLDVAFLKR